MEKYTEAMKNVFNLNSRWPSHLVRTAEINFEKKKSLALDNEGFNESLKTKEVLAKFQLPLKMTMPK